MRKWIRSFPPIFFFSTFRLCKHFQIIFRSFVKMQLNFLKIAQWTDFILKERISLKNISFVIAFLTYCKLFIKTIGFKSNWKCKICLQEIRLIYYYFLCAIYSFCITYSKIVLCFTIITTQINLDLSIFMS